MFLHLKWSDGEFLRDLSEDDFEVDEVIIVCVEVIV